MKVSESSKPIKGRNLPRRCHQKHGGFYFVYPAVNGKRRWQFLSDRSNEARALAEIINRELDKKEVQDV